jgi:hypothetical protein
LKKNEQLHRPLEFKLKKMLSTLKPILTISDDCFNRITEKLSPDILPHYGQGTLSNEACLRLMVGYEEYIQPLKKILPKSWEILSEGIHAAYAIEFLVGLEGNVEPCNIFPIYPTPSGFCSFGLYHPGPSPNTVEEDLASFYKRVAKLPYFLQEILRCYEAIFVNTKSEYYGAPDIAVLKSIPYSGSSILNLDIGKRKRRLAKQFGDLFDMRLLAYRNDPRSWALFFDNSDKGDGTIYVAMDAAFADVRRLASPQEAYDAMFAHYIAGAEGEFDFSPYTELP